MIEVIHIIMWFQRVSCVVDKKGDKGHISIRKFSRNIWWKFLCSKNMPVRFNAYQKPSDVGLKGRNSTKEPPTSVPYQL